MFCDGIGKRLAQIKPKFREIPRRGYFETLLNSPSPLAYCNALDARLADPRTHPLCLGRKTADRLKRTHPTERPERRRW